MAALFLFFLFHIAGNAILDFADEFFEKQKLEDAHFTTYIPITESDIEDMEEEYGIALEEQSYLNIDTDGTTARVFQKTRKVDLYNVTEGEDADEKRGNPVRRLCRQYGYLYRRSDQDRRRRLYGDRFLPKAGLSVHAGK